MGNESVSPNRIRGHFDGMRIPWSPPELVPGGDDALPAAHGSALKPLAERASARPRPSRTLCRADVPPGASSGLRKGYETNFRFRAIEWGEAKVWVLLGRKP